ncbi:MAG: AbrB family transcriptional regulator [Thermoplasmata archaeon]|nr:MAG: AbrB family transcriptional regulator [Thermoplasmata archaeon]
MTRGHLTRLAKATSKSESLRTTVPAGVVRDLDLNLGDRLRWVIHAQEDGTLVARVKKE